MKANRSYSLWIILDWLKKFYSGSLWKNQVTFWPTQYKLKLKSSWLIVLLTVHHHLLKSQFSFCSAFVWLWYLKNNHSVYSSVKITTNQLTKTVLYGLCSLTHMVCGGHYSTTFNSLGTVPLTVMWNMVALDFKRSLYNLKLYVNCIIYLYIGNVLEESKAFLRSQWNPYLKCFRDLPSQ